MTTTTVVPAETATEITTEIPVITDATPPPPPESSAASADDVEDGPVDDTAPAGPGESDTPVIGADTAPVSLNEHAKTWAEQLRGNWTPPDLWNHGRPSLKSSWLWAIKGQHLPDDPRMRTASRAGTGALIPFRALFLGLDWIFERMSRVVAALVLIFAVIQMIHPMI